MSVPFPRLEIVLDGEIAAMQSDEALAEAIKAQEDALRVRRERVSMRAERDPLNSRVNGREPVLICACTSISATASASSRRRCVTSMRH